MYSLTRLPFPGEHFISRRESPGENEKGSESRWRNVEFDDIEFIETAEELLATSYYKNIQ
ncbi:hypothetical protein ADL34_15705 [Streptomyces sp. NRRL WC-3605]|nr:hypothetical protein ADL34_15705 [Streptomyces sp. NRRL WC-3605]